MFIFAEKNQERKNSPNYLKKKIKEPAQISVKI